MNTIKKDVNSRKIAVITSSVGSNNLINPTRWLDKVEYHAFVDKKDINISDSWNRHEYIQFSSDIVYKNRRNAKIYKILPHAFLPNFDYYIWVDATHNLQKDPDEIIDEYLTNSDVAVFKHSQRDCVYDEGNEIIKIKYDHSNLIKDQLAFYRDMCYPKNNGLYELPARVQRNTELTQRMGWMWWEQICMFSSRDQISFPFVCHQLGIKPSILPGKANTIRGNTIMPQIVYSNHSRTA